jgi:ATP-dependent DNA helicase RecQ
MVDLHEPLRELFGFSEFRPGQEGVVRAAIEGRDTLAVMPTGSGKSLTYQLAAMLRPKPTLVLSPLIALMKDQVDKLPPSLAATATFVNSSLDATEAAARLDGVASGRTRLLYAAPERLRQRAFVDTLRRIDVGLVVVDEAHCVSMWGHDFRPDYLFIRRALDELGEPAVLGMTATATPSTATEIAAALGRPLDVVRTSVVRANLRYDVEEAANEQERLEVLVERLGALTDGSAIVYARSRRSCEEIARTLRGHGLRLEHYHAGLEADERTRVQDDFLVGRIRGVVATTAFGMGIDKPDVRLVALVNLPDSLESYVQMVGRAGRDGRPSATLLLAGRADAQALRRFATGSQPTSNDLRALYRALRDAGGPVDPQALAAAVGDRHDPRVLVGMLEQAGIVRRGFDAGRALRVELLAVDDSAAATLEALLDRYAAEAEARCGRIISFAESRTCRHRQVAEHFGERLDEPCGACDVCAPLPRRATRPAPPPLPDDVGAAIAAAVAGLAWPLGRRSLAQTLRGSPKAPPSARRSAAFGSLAAATEAEVTRWIRALEAAGVLDEHETEDGFRVLRLVPGATVPSLRGRPAADGRAEGVEPLFDALRSWRTTRSQADGVPAYVVLHDATLRELAASRPTTRAELAAVTGMGTVKVERYGDDVLAVLAAG